MTKTKPIRLASYNIRKCVGLDRRRKPERILSILNELEADIVVLQEADRRLGARPSAVPRHLIEAETDYAPVEVAPNDVSLGWHGNAVLVRKGLQPGDVHRITLPGTEPRGAVAVAFPGVTVVGVHLGLLRRDRRRQLAALRAALPKGRPTAVLGDFNEWSRRSGLEPLSDFEVHAPGRSYHAARPIAALDRIALGPDLRLADAGVRETRTARIASDHLPVWADVEPVAGDVRLIG